MYDEAVGVASFRKMDVAHRVGRVLEGEGIPYLVRANDFAADPQTVGATIFVASDVAERAREVLIAIKNGEPLH
jgi:hypothetical protein